ncbi:MAG: tyrosine-type recombinase/integrase [Parcubacteria group bacterium]
MGEVRGLYQKTPGGVWMLRRKVPNDVRHSIQGRWRGRTWFIESTGQHRKADAITAARVIWERWDTLIDEARTVGSGPVAALESVIAGLDRWRAAACAKAAGVDPGEVGRAEVEALVKDVRAQGAFAILGPFTVDVAEAGGSPVPSFGKDAEAWARGYFAARPDAPRSPELPFAVGLLLGRLQIAARDPGGWSGVADFDKALDAAFAAGVVLGLQEPPVLVFGWSGLPEPGAALEAAVAAAGGVPRITTAVRQEARQRFARAWLEVVQHIEAERRRAALFVAALDALAAPASAIRVASAPTFAPREGDRTVGELIDAFKAARDAPDTEKQYGHVFRALGELLGRDKPVRAITREDVREVRRFLGTIPTNASKVYPDVSLAEAAERGAEEGRPTLAPNTVRSYVVNLKAMMNFARAEGWIELNPVDGQVPSKDDSVRRRAFTREELEKVFAALDDERALNSAKWWVPAVLAFTGARANEIAQLQVADVKEVAGVPYIDLTLFDATGRRVDDKQLKTRRSPRAVPLHKNIIDAGFLTFVEAQRTAGEVRLFPELGQVFGRYSHEISKHFGRTCDRAGLSDPSLTLHSLRHGFREAGRDAGLSEEVIDALGGWAPKGEGARYGDRNSPSKVPQLAAHLEKITLGGFTFGPAPVTTAEAA